MRKLLLIAVLMLCSVDSRAELTSVIPTNFGMADIDGNIAGTYVSKRDSTSGNHSSESILYLGQESDPNYAIRRLLGTYAIPNMVSVSACSLFFDGAADLSTTDFEIYVLSASDYGSIDKTDYKLFDGWAASGQYTGSVLNETWNSSGYAADWNCIVFNAAGLDTVLAHSDGSLYLAMISKEDYNSSQPSTAEVIGVTGTGGATKPYLSIDYVSGWAGNVFGVTNPSIIFGIEKADVTSVMGVE